MRVPVFSTPADDEALRTLFDAAGYHDRRLRDLLGQDGTAACPPDAAVWRRRVATEQAAGTLFTLLAAGADVTRAELFAALGDGGIAVLERTGLVQRAAGALRATVRLVPTDVGWLASDRRDSHHADAPDFVVGVSPVSRRLMGLTVPRPVESALDLGCGCGVLALGLARHAARVVATDVNPRAVAMTRFNAALNGVSRVQPVEGDLFSDAAGGSFDLIVSNPPFVLSPEATFLYRDGGVNVSRRILREAPDHLTENGWFQMLCNWPQRSGQEWWADVQSWIAGDGYDVWVLRERTLDPLSYAGVWLAQQYPDGIPEAALAGWLEYLAREEIESVGSGLIVIRKTSGRPWQEFRDMPGFTSPAGDSIARTIDARDWVSQRADDELLEARLSPSPDLEYREVRRPTAHGWNVTGPRLTSAAGLHFSVHGDPVATAIIGLLDGHRSLRGAAADLAAAHSISLDSLLPQLPGTFRQLLWLGLVLPASSVTRQ